MANAQAVRRPVSSPVSQTLGVHQDKPLFGIDEYPDDIAARYANGDFTQEELVTHLCTVLYPIHKVFVAFNGVLDGVTLACICDAQTAMVADAATAVERSKATTSTKDITPKVSKRGAISFYGINSMPVTLYEPQLRRFAGEQLGMSTEAFNASRIGLWIASNPTRVFTGADYKAGSTKEEDAKDVELWRSICAGEQAWATKRGDTVAVSLSAGK